MVLGRRLWGTEWVQLEQDSALEASFWGQTNIEVEESSDDEDSLEDMHSQRHLTKTVE